MVSPLPQEKTGVFFVRLNPWFVYFGVTALVLVGCDDSTRFQIHPILVSDTVTVYAPLPQNAGLPYGLDITSDGAFGVMGGRFPEHPDHALQWDFLVQVQNGQVVLVPPRVLGVTDSRAAITLPLQGVTFEELREAPGAAAFVGDSAIAMVPGNVHAARSRELGIFGGACIQYSKLQPLEVDVATGSLHLRIVTNERCADPRLVPLD
jgi:hypothetical protein